MKFIELTLLLSFTCICASAQIDTAKMILGDWYHDGENVLNLNLDDQLTFSRINNDSLYLKWTFTEDQKFVRSGSYKSPDKDYPIGHILKPVNYYFTNSKSVVFIRRKSYEIVSLDAKFLTIKRIE